MKSLEQNYDKHLVVTVIVLVALPILLWLSELFFVYRPSCDCYPYYDEIFTFFYERIEDPALVQQSVDQFEWALHTLQYAIFAVMLILYPIYPIIYSMEKHFNRRNPKSTIREYQILKKITYALLPLFFFFIAYRISLGIAGDNPLSSLVLSLDERAQSMFLPILGAILFAVGSALLRITILNTSKRFKFYLARLSFRAISKVEDEVERMRYLIWGLGFYNKYIRRTLGLQINDPKIIYSKVIADAAVDKNHSMKELCRAFEDNDKLKPIRCLTALLDVEDTEHFLVKEPLGKRLENWGGIIGTLASTIAAVIGALATLGVPGLS